MKGDLLVNSMQILTGFDYGHGSGKRKLMQIKLKRLYSFAKKVKLCHPHISLGNDRIERKSQHKHLCTHLDSELNFQSHVKEAIGKATRGIGMIRYLSKYVSRYVLDQFYKLYVRPRLNYGSTIYHKYNPEKRLSFTQRLEQTQ